MADLTAQNKWEPLATDNSDREKIWSKSRTFAGDVWFRFRRKPTAIAGFVIIIALTLFAFGRPPVYPRYDYSVQNLEVVNVPPVMKVYQIPQWRLPVHYHRPESHLRYPGRQTERPVAQGAR